MKLIQRPWILVLPVVAVLAWTFLDRARGIEAGAPEPSTARPSAADSLSGTRGASADDRLRVPLELPQSTASEPDPAASAGPPSGPTVIQDLAYEERAFKWLFETTSLEHLRLERDRLEQEYLALAQEPFEAAFERGDRELESFVDGRYQIPRAPLPMIRYWPRDDETYWYVLLDPAEHPDVATAFKHSAWLSQLVNRAEARLAAESPPPTTK